MKLPETTLVFLDQLISTGNVVAIGLGGSQASGTATAQSDFDIYILTNTQIDPAIRRKIIMTLADADQPVETANPFWGDEDGFAIDGIWHDVVYFDADWFFSEIDRVLNHHLPREGYTTSFVFTLANMMPLYDPKGLLTDWQQQTETYPETLAHAIIAANYPVACTIHASYRNQIARAVELGDTVAVNHRLAAFLACVFDIAFAHLRMWHPGEKRQIWYLDQHKHQLPVGFNTHLTDALRAASPEWLEDAIPAVDRICQDIAEIAVREVRT